MKNKPMYGIDKVLALVTEDSPVWPRGASYATCRRWRKEDPTTALYKLIHKTGSQAKLGRGLGVSQKTISTWLRADIPNPPAKEPSNEVERAVVFAGGQPKMAAELGVTQQCVSRWCRDGYVPAPRAQEIEMRWGVPRAGLLNPKLRNALGTGGEL